MITTVTERSGQEPTYASSDVFVVEKYFLIHRVQCFAHLESGEFYTIAACGRRFTTKIKPNLTNFVNIDERCNECWVQRNHGR